MIEIPLRNRARDVVAYAVIDDRDAHLAKHRWHRTSHGYAGRGVHRGPGLSPRCIKMHREIMVAMAGVLPPLLQVDHIDGDRLNNRRSNLRLVTKAEQMQNVRARASTSPYRGVCWDGTYLKWLAQAQVARRNHFLGYFDDEEEAARVASAFRLAHMTHTNEARHA